MTSRYARLIVLAAVTLTLAACTSDEVATPTAEPSPDAALAMADGSAAPACAPGNGSASDLPDWPLAGDGEATFLPVIMSSLISYGHNRFLYNVLDDAYRQVAAEDVPSRVDFYAIERDPKVPHARAGATYLSSGLGRGLYRTQVDFDCVGEWGAEVFVQGADGEWVSERLRFTVFPVGSTPAIGEPGLPSDSLTASTPEEVALISTDLNPYPLAYDKTVAETISSGSPSMVFFATPAFCQTGFCGPTVELVKSVAREYEGELEFVNVEPYELEMTENGLQPRLDEGGQLQPVVAAVEWGIPVEPYLFVLDADGRVFARFEGVVGGDELRAAVEDVLSA